MPRKVLVLHAIDSLCTGGAQVMLAALLEELVDEDRFENHVLVTSTRPADPALERSVRECSSGLRSVSGGLRDPRLLAAVGAELRRVRPDVVHSHLTTASVSTRIAARRGGIPHLTTVHTPPGPGFEGGRRRAFADRSTAWMSDRLAAPSAAIARQCADSFRLPASRFEVIANAAPPRRPPSKFDRLATRRRLSGSEHRPIVLCVSRLEPEKGIEDLIEATALLRRTLPEVKVLVAGDGGHERNLRAAITAAGLHDSLELLGRRGDVGELLAAADAFCLPSRHEGVPLSLIEALSAGLPCAATAVGGVPELLGGAGILVEAGAPADLAIALERLLTEPDLAAGLAAHGRQIARRYVPAVAAGRYASLYRRLADDHPVR